MNTQVVRPPSPPPPASRKRGTLEALRPVLMAAALLGGLVLAAAIAMIVTAPPRPRGSTFTLTVHKPTGGTITGSGITCGTEGTSCSISVTDGQRVELQAQADEGYSFAGFMLDCASSGSYSRFEMKADRSCGARFDRRDDGAVGPRWTLTLTPPENGTIVTAEGHECGPRKKLCTAQVAEGTIVAIDVLPEEGYRVQSYTGDCVDGTANMTRDRSCGVAMVKGQGPPPPRPEPPGPRGPAVVSGSTTQGPAVSPKPPPPSVAVTTPQTPTEAAGTASPATVTPSTPTPTASAPPAAAGTPASPSAPPPAQNASGREGDIEKAKKDAEADIQRVLKAYRGAYERMDIPALKRLQPGISVASHELRFKDLKAVKYTFGGDPQIEELDVELGRARALVDLKTENEQKSGKKQKPAEGKATYLLRRIGLGANWEIVEIKYAMNEK